MSRKSKPFGLVLIMVYAVLGALVSIPTGLLLLLGSIVPGTSGLLLTVTGLFFIVLGVLELCAVIGLKSLSEWGRNLTFWLSIISIPLGVLAIFPLFPDTEFTAGNTILQIFGIGISALIIHYLLRPSVRSLFSQNVD